MQETTELSMDNAIEALMAQEPEVAEAEVIESEVDEVETEAEETEVEDSDDSEYAEDADEDEDEDEYEGDEGEIDSEELDDQAETKLYPVKIDGEIVNVTLSDLTKGYGGDQFNQKNMRHNAEQRKLWKRLLITLTSKERNLTSRLNTLIRTDWWQNPLLPQENCLQMTH